MNAAAISGLLYRRSWLLGLSGVSNDMRTIEASPTPEAQEAIDYFVFRIRRAVSSAIVSHIGLNPETQAKMMRGEIVVELVSQGTLVERFLIEKPIRGDFALIAARQADYVGNLEYSLTAHNFNPIMALAAKAMIAEPEHIVPADTIGSRVLAMAVE
jgi:acetate CoA/acetoacetate CoA-transferase alpha subunit